MVEIILKELAYCFYPKGIDALNEEVEYINSKEYSLLNRRLSFFKNHFDSSKVAGKYFKTLEPLLKKKKLMDGTLYDWQDRCLNFQLYEVIDKRTLTSLCINISFLVPYYTIYFLEVDIDPETGKWMDLPRRNLIIEREMKKEINFIKKSTEKYFGYSFFDENLESIIVEDLSFQDIPQGSFTLFNAFFLNEKSIRI